MEYETIKQEIAELELDFTEEATYCGHIFRTSFLTDWGTTISIEIRYTYSSWGNQDRIECDVGEWLDDAHPKAWLWFDATSPIRDIVTMIREGCSVFELEGERVLSDLTQEITEVNEQLTKLGFQQSLIPVPAPEIQQFRDLNRHRGRLWKHPVARLLMGKVDATSKKMWKIQRIIRDRDRQQREERITPLLHEIESIEALARPLRHQLTVLRRCERCQQWREDKCHDVVKCFWGIDD